MTQSELSTGRSFSSPTEDLSSVSGRHRVGGLDGILIPLAQSAQFPPPQFLVEIEAIEVQESLAEPRSRMDIPALFPWRFEFSWGNGQLLLAGELLDTQGTSNSSGRVKRVASPETWATKSRLAQGSTILSASGDGR